MPQDSQDFMIAFIRSLPQAHALGLSLVRAAPGCVTMSMPYAEHLIGDPVTRVVHGGAVSTLMDTCCGAAVMSHPEMNGVETATLDLRIDYMRAAPPGLTILAQAQCYHVTRTVAFVRAQAWAEDQPDQPVASAAGAFTASQPPDRPITGEDAS